MTASTNICIDRNTIDTNQFDLTRSLVVEEFIADEFAEDGILVLVSLMPSVLNIEVDTGDLPKAVELLKELGLISAK